MQYRKLGDSDLEVSDISLGSWLTYGVGVEADKARSCLDAAFDVGINFIDTANVYGRGAAETFLGEALKSRPRDSYVLATKVYFPMSDTDSGLSRAQIEKQLDASLRRLRTDFVDLYQCHRYDWDTPLEYSAGIGVRWKPLTAHNLVLSMSRVFGPKVNEDWLAQVGYSWDYGTDLRVDRPSWWTTRISAEVGRYLDAGNDYGVAQAMVGRSYLEPYLKQSARYIVPAIEDLAEATAVVGLGLNANRFLELIGGDLDRHVARARAAPGG